MERYTEKSNNSKAWIFIVVLLVALLVALVIVLPQFYIESVAVEGNRKLSAQEIEDYADLEDGKHLFSYISGEPLDYLTLRYSDVEDSLKSYFPYIENVKVQASFPYQVKITIEEKVEVAYVYSKYRYVAIDRNGDILSVETSKPETNAPIIDGINLRSHNIGETISDDIKRQVNRALLLFTTILESDDYAKDDLSMSQMLQDIRPYQANALYFSLTNAEGENLRIKIDPSEDMRSTIDWLRHVIKSGTLDSIDNIERGILSITSEQQIFDMNASLPPKINEVAEVEDLDYDSEETQLTTSVDGDENDSEGDVTGEDGTGDTVDENADDVDVDVESEGADTNGETTPSTTIDEGTNE